MQVCVCVCVFYPSKSYDNIDIFSRYLVWQEVFDNGVNIADDTVVHIWKDGGMPAIFKEELIEVNYIIIPHQVQVDSQ